MSYWSYRHIDAVWPFFAIGAVLSTYIAFENRKLFYFILAGVLIGTSYLTKQSAILLMPLPVLLFVFVKNYRQKDMLFGIMAYVVFVLLLTVPWISYVYIKTENLKLAVSGVGSDNLTLGLNMSDKLTYYFNGLASYYSNGKNALLNNFMIAPLFIISWVYVIYRALRKERSSIILVSCVLLLSPYISIVGQHDLRVGQLIIFLLLTYLCVAISIMSLSKEIANRINQPRPTQNRNMVVSISLFIIFCLLFLQIFVSKNRDKGAFEFFQRSVVWNHFAGKGEKKRVDGTSNSPLYNIVRWIEDIINKDEGIFFSWQTDARTIYFLTKGAYRVQQIPFIWFDIKDFRLKPLKGMMENVPENLNVPKLNDILFISSQLGTPNPKNRYLWVLYESCFVDSINKDNINYIVVGSIFHSLYKYLEKSPYFSCQVSFNDNNYKIYKVVSKPELTNHEIYITTRTLNWLKNLRKDAPDLFNRYKEIGFKNQIGISPQVVESLVTKSLPEKFVEVDFIR
jgi:hypothetical protein